MQHHPVPAVGSLGGAEERADPAHVGELQAREVEMEDAGEPVAVERGVQDLGEAVHVGSVDRADQPQAVRRIGARDDELLVPEDDRVLVLFAPLRVPLSPSDTPAF